MSPHVSVMFTIIYKSFLTNYIGMVFPRAFLFKKALPQIQHWYGFPQYESLYAGQDSFLCKSFLTLTTLKWIFASMSPYM